METRVQLPRSHSAERACLKIQRGPSARLLALASVGSARAARCGDAQASPPWPPPKSAAAGPLSIFIQALIHFHDLVVSAGNPRTRAPLSASPLRQRCQVRPERRSVTGLNLTFIVQGPVFPTVLLIRTSKAGCKPALRPPNRQKYVYLFHSCDSWASPHFHISLPSPCLCASVV